MSLCRQQIHHLKTTGHLEMESNSRKVNSCFLFFLFFREIDFIFMCMCVGVFGVYVTRVWVPRGQETVLDPLGAEATGRIHAEPLTGVLGTKFWS